MIINGKHLLQAHPIRNMVPYKKREHGVSHGLSEVGYDIRIKQTVNWIPPNPYLALSFFENRGRIISEIGADSFNKTFLEYFHGYTEVIDGDKTVTKTGRTAIASSVEYFNVPKDMWCKFSNKSTFARVFVDPCNGTDAEPGWRGHLTIEIIFHDNQPIVIQGGSGLLKAVFQKLANEADYGMSKYQDQEDRPVAAIFEGA